MFSENHMEMPSPFCSVIELAGKREKKQRIQQSCCLYGGSKVLSCYVLLWFYFFKELLILKAKIIVFDRYLFLVVESLLNFESQ